MVLDFWLISLVFMMVIGSGLTVVNNLGEVVISLENLPSGSTVNYSDLPHNKYTTALATLFSVINTLSRMVFGFTSDKLIHRIDRSFWAIVCSLLMCLTHLLFAFSPINLLFLGIALMGAAYGGMFCIIPTLVSEIFGLKNFGTNLGIVTTAPALGSYLLGTLLAGKLSSYFEKKSFIIVQSSDGQLESHHCLGSNCYHYTFLITSGLCLCATLLAFGVWWRQKRNKNAFDEKSTPLLK